MSEESSTAPACSYTLTEDELAHVAGAAMGLPLASAMVTASV